jgi:hypothetical protein
VLLVIYPPWRPFVLIVCFLGLHGVGSIVPRRIGFRFIGSSDFCMLWRYDTGLCIMTCSIHSKPGIYESFK